MKRNKYLKQLLILCVSLFLPARALWAQLHQYTFEQLDSLQAKEQRPVLLFFYTSWCRHCQTMKETTFKNKEVVQLLNEATYFIPFDAEDKKSISLRGRTFVYKPTGINTGVHELAEQLATVNGESTYPTISILNPRYEIVYQHTNFLSAQNLLSMLKQLMQYTKKEQQRETKQGSSF